MVSLCFRVTVSKYLSSGTIINTRQPFEEEELTDTVHQHLVPSQAFLEPGAHETIAGARVGKNGEMDPEKRQVNNDGYHNQPKSTGTKVAPEMFLGRDEMVRQAPGNNTNHRRVFPNVQKIPEVDEDSDANSNNREHTVHFGAPGTCHEDTGSD